MVDNIIAGLMSGLVVTMCVLVFGQLWKKIIVPWLEDLVYKDVHIEGCWHSLYLYTEEFRKETIEIQRHGHKVHGSITCISGPDTGKIYEFSGSFRNMILPICYESRDKGKADRGTITLKCIWNADRLDGVTACYSDTKDKIGVLPVTWFRSMEALKSAEERIKSRREQLRILSQQQKEIENKIECIEKSGQPNAKDCDTTVGKDSSRIETNNEEAQNQATALPLQPAEDANNK